MYYVVLELVPVGTRVQVLVARARRRRPHPDPLISRYVMMETPRATQAALRRRAESMPVDASPSDAGIAHPRSSTSKVPTLSILQPKCPSMMVGSDH